MKTIRIIYADDHDLWRRAIIDALRPFNFDTCGEARNGLELLPLMYLDPDLLLLDLSMPVMNGSEAFDIIRNNYPQVKIVIVSFFIEEILLKDFMLRGAVAFIGKNECANFGHLAKVLKECHEGTPYFSKTLRERKNFSKAEIEIIPAIVEGLTNKAIARECNVQERAIEKRKQSLPSKIGGKTMNDFLKFAIISGYQFLSKKF